MSSIKINRKKKYKNLVVTKPWGSEYIACENNTTATWLLKIKKNHKTSLHCHPKKKTGFIILDGKVEVELGFYEKVKLKAPSKLMIRPGLFHSTKALSKNNATILEVETPIDKNDLVRFKDNYGRENRSYEGKNKKKKIIACICSGAQLLISAKVVKGRKISGYYSMKDDLVNAGATYIDLPAVVDHNIVTTAHYKDLGPWMKAVLKVFYDKYKNQS